MSDTHTLVRCACRLVAYPQASWDLLGEPRPDVIGWHRIGHCKSPFSGMIYPTPPPTPEPTPPTLADARAADLRGELERRTRAGQSAIAVKSALTELGKQVDFVRVLETADRYGVAVLLVVREPAVATGEGPWLRVREVDPLQVTIGGDFDGLLDPPGRTL